MSRKNTARVEKILAGEVTTVDDGKRRHLSLSNTERDALARNRMIEDIVAMLLDIETAWSNRAIAESVGLSLPALKRLTQSEEFMKVYTEHLAMVGHSPRLMAAKSNIDEMVPMATRKIRNILTSADSNDQAALKAAEYVLKVAGIESGEQADDSQAFKRFLEANGIKTSGNNAIFAAIVPPGYMEAMNKYNSAIPETTDATEVVDGAVVPDDDQKSSS